MLHCSPNSNVSTRFNCFTAACQVRGIKYIFSVYDENVAEAVVSIVCCRNLATEEAGKGEEKMVKLAVAAIYYIYSWAELIT